MDKATATGLSSSVSSATRVPKRYPSHQCRGAKSFVDDLGFGRGVVLSRAATSLRSIETKPFDWKICPHSRRTHLREPAPPRSEIETGRLRVPPLLRDGRLWFARSPAVAPCRGWAVWRPNSFVRKFLLLPVSSCPGPAFAEAGEREREREEEDEDEGIRGNRPRRPRVTWFAGRGALP